MTKRLTEKQKEEIVKSFKNGIAIDNLSQEYNCTNTTIIRNLKKILGELKYKEYFNKSKTFIEKSLTNKNRTNDFKKTDFDSDDLRKDSNNPDVLNKNNSLNLYVVGHTDDKGSPEYNLGLSSKRAKAVVKALVSQYGIKESRLIGYGVGPYAPSANNKNDLGRQLNRRVELVERLSN